jgi:excisionase family DNA binding protein
MRPQPFATLFRVLLNTCTISRVTLETPLSIDDLGIPVREAAKALGVSERTCRQYIADGMLSVHRIAPTGRVRVPLSEISRLLRGGR